MQPYTAVVDALPDLPQVQCIRQAAEALRPRQDVSAFWIGGSFARGDPDRFSDVDMRIAVAQDDLEAWREPDWAALLGDSAVGHQMLQFDETSFLHHLVLSQGTLVDFFVQAVDHPVSKDAHLILKCDDAGLRDRIQAAVTPERKDLPEAKPQELRAAIEELWIISHKDAKVLFRDLDLLVLVGMQLQRTLLMRLWYAWLTGKDLGKQRPTIHLLTQATRTIQEHFGPQALAILGAPVGTRQDILHWIAVVRREVAGVGSKLAAKYGFTYPDALENTVRQSWAACEPDLRTGGAAHKTAACL